MFVFEAGIESAVKRHVSSHCRAGKSAENGERSKSLFHFEIHSKSNLTEQNANFDQSSELIKKLQHELPPSGCQHKWNPCAVL